MGLIGIVDSDKSRMMWENLMPDDTEPRFGDDFSTECDAVIVSARYAAGRLPSVLLKAQTLGIPAAVVCETPDCTQQDSFFKMGADDVIFIPLSKEMLARRIRSMCLMQQDKCRAISMESILRIAEVGRGSYEVRAEDFEGIYRFVLRLLERVGISVQIIVMKLHFNGGSYDGGEMMERLSESVHNCLRKGDITSVCGTDRMMILLIGANDEGGHLAASRIINSFYGACTDERFEVSYDIKAVGDHLPIK